VIKMDNLSRRDESIEKNVRGGLHMLIHPSESGHNRQIRDGVEHDLGAEPFSDYFNRTGPLVDIFETTDAVVVSCEVAGLESKDDVSIHLSGKNLTINGIIQRASEDTQDNRYHRTERFYGNFYRVVQLPATVAEDSAKASYRNGVLEIRMSKSEVSGKRVDIEFQ
jgi:HSP20 family protein